MKFSKNLYWEDNVSETKKKTIKWRLKLSKKTLHVYLLCKNTGCDLLDIIDSRTVAMQSFYRRNPPYVIGIARTYEGALLLVKRILEDCQITSGGTDFKKFLEEME